MSGGTEVKLVKPVIIHNQRHEAGDRVTMDSGMAAELRQRGVAAPAAVARGQPGLGQAKPEGK